MCPEVNSKCAVNDLYAYRSQQNCRVRSGDESLSDRIIILEKPDNPPTREGSDERQSGGLEEHPEELPVKFFPVLDGNEFSEIGAFCNLQSETDPEQRIRSGQGHPHLARDNGAVIVEQYGIEKLEDKIGCP